MPIGTITFTRKQSAFPENLQLSFYIALARTESHHYPELIFKLYFGGR